MPTELDSRSMPVVSLSWPPSHHHFVTCSHLREVVVYCPIADLQVTSGSGEWHESSQGITSDWLAGLMRCGSGCILDVIHRNTGQDQQLNEQTFMIC